MILWHTLSRYFRSRYGIRVQKIPLDAGGTCPNRDGTLSRAGCTFCNAFGSGSGLMAQGVDLPAQWERWRAKYRATDANRAFMAYFQSFSNTHGSADAVRSLLDTVAALPDNRGVAVGTRPDCLDAEKLEAIARCPLPEVWLELGLQSMHDATLRRVARHHGRADSERAVYAAAARGIKVCGHLMAGLPGEDVEDFLASVRWAVGLPLAGLKLHCLYVCRGAALARDYGAGHYAPLAMDTYVDAVARALALVPSHVVMHRLTGDPAPGELIAPGWCLHKRPVFTALHHCLRERRWWQGCQADVPDARPEWYGA